MIAMGLNDAMIVCLYHIQVGISESYILVVMNLNDIWSSDGNSCHDMHRSIDIDDRVQKMINIGDEVRNNLGHLDRVDNYKSELSANFAGGAKMTALQEVASETMLSCSIGCLMSQDSLLVPDAENDYGTVRMVHICHGLLLICVAWAAIVWMYS